MLDMHGIGESPADGVIVTAVVNAEASTGVLDAFDDAVLLGRIGGRDRKAFRIFYHRHAGRVSSALRQLCRDAALADDLLQEVFLQVWRKAGSYRAERGDVGGWLFTITRNKFIDQRRRGSLPIDDGADLTVRPAPACGPAREERLSLHQALDTLSAEQRQAVSLTYLGGLTYDETAARLQVPLGTLKSRLRTGLRHLRDRLGGA